MQAAETVDWLSDYFLRGRLNKPDLRSYGLYSAWTPYVGDVVTFWGHLGASLLNTQLSSCSREPVGGAKVLAGKRLSPLPPPPHSSDCVLDSVYFW